MYANGGGGGGRAYDACVDKLHIKGFLAWVPCNPIGMALGPLGARGFLSLFHKPMRLRKVI